MIFRMGRQDVEDEGEASTALAVTAGKHENAIQSYKFGKMGLDAGEYVALMGSYTLGFANDDNQGRSGRWCQNPYIFDNTYF